ncbi:MAG: hypothetical protein CMH54_00700 [Myxococcales bacterium]|nr:hypothetical protein [Myxococcales bacterium]
MSAPVISPDVLELLRHQSGLSIDRDGCFQHKSGPITHERILATLYRGLEMNDDGQLIVRVADQWAYIPFEDSPYVVQNIRVMGSEPAENLELLLVGGRREPLDAASLELKGTHDLYCQVESGRAWARFSRVAYHNLLPFIIEQKAAPSGYGIQLGSTITPIALFVDK